MKAVWQDFPALHQHFFECSQDQSRNVKERSKCAGLVKKIESWFFLAEVAMLQDALFVLMQLSLYFQSDNVSVTSAHLHIDATKKKFLGLKDANGSHLTEFFTSFDNDLKFKGVTVLKCTSDDAKFQQTKNQFFQALHDNIDRRFPCTDLLKDALVLNTSTWPTDVIQLALYGDRELVSMCTVLGLNTNSTMLTLTEFTEYKKTFKMGANIRKLLLSIETFPISTATCERGFSAMNQAHTETRNRLSSERVSSLLMLSINGPQLIDFNARKYVISWLKKGRHSGKDCPTGLAKCKTPTAESAKIFMQ
jgi:hAT family C-terminal dimerisation region